MSSYIHVGRKLKRRKASYIRVSRKLKQRTKNSTVNRIRSRWAGTRTPCLQRTTSHRNPSIRGDCGTHSRYPCQKRGPKVQDELTANETTHKNSRLEEREPRPTDDVTEHTGGLARVGLARKLARRKTGIGHVTKHVSNGRTRDSDSSQMTKQQAVCIGMTWSSWHLLLCAIC